MRVNPIVKFFESKSIQGIYKKICDPKHANFFNNTLPTVESLASTACYVVATEKQKDIPREQKTLIQWQNVLSGIAGMAIGSFLNRKVSNLANALEPKIDKNIMDIHKVATGLKVGLPLLATALVMRFAMPIVITQLSCWIEEYRRPRRKLDKIA